MSHHKEKKKKKEQIKSNSPFFGVEPSEVDSTEEESVKFKKWWV